MSVLPSARRLRESPPAAIGNVLLGRRLAALAVMGAIATSGLLAARADAADEVVRFPAQTFADGTVVPAHRSYSADGSDRAAASRRDELVRSPYVQSPRELAVRDGEILLALDSTLPESIGKALAAGLEAASAQAFDRDGWMRPFSKRSPLRIVIGRGRDGVSASGWSGREKGVSGALTRPLVSVSGGERPVDAVLLDAVHELGILTLRQAVATNAPPAWAVQGLAEWFARRALGYRGDPAADDADPLRAESGSLREPVAAAAYFEALAARLPAGAADLRAAWEEAGGRGDAEALLRELSTRADPRGLSGVLADLLASRVESGGLSSSRLARRPQGDLNISAPGPLAWRRLSLRTSGERGGLELSIPDSGLAGGRAVVFYGGQTGGFDAAPLEPGGTKTLPLSGTGEIAILLVDGDARDLAIRARRVPDYPAALVASGAEWVDGSVRVSWRTASHRDLLAWVLTRYEESPEGGWREAGRHLVPTSSSSDSDFDYYLVDRDAAPDRRALFRVFALTTEGFLSETFEASVAPAR